MSNRWIVAVAILAAAPGVAAAQFTTFIAPPNPVQDSVKAAVKAEQVAVSDSITRAQITDMKTWVDSAAGIAPVPPADTAFRVQTETATAYSNGMVAPATASPLPFIALLGMAFLSLGAVLLWRPRPRPKRY